MRQITLDALRSELASLRAHREKLWADLNQAIGAERVVEQMVDFVQQEEAVVDKPDVEQDGDRQPSGSDNVA